MLIYISVCISFHLRQNVELYDRCKIHNSLLIPVCKQGCMFLFTFVKYAIKILFKAELVFLASLLWTWINSIFNIFNWHSYIWYQFLLGSLKYFNETSNLTSKINKWYLKFFGSDVWLLGLNIQNMLRINITNNVID